jgi:hypothetical protein
MGHRPLRHQASARWARLPNRTYVLSSDVILPGQYIDWTFLVLVYLLSSELVFTRGRRGHPVVYLRSRKEASRSNGQFFPISSVLRLKQSTFHLQRFAVRVHRDRGCLRPRLPDARRGTSPTPFPCLERAGTELTSIFFALQSN